MLLIIILMMVIIITILCNNIAYTPRNQCIYASTVLHAEIVYIVTIYILGKNVINCLSTCFSRDKSLKRVITFSNLYSGIGLPKSRARFSSRISLRHF